MVMAKIREKIWVLRLRKLAKKVISECFECKRFRAQPASTPTPGLLPKFRTEQSTPFDVIGVNIAAPVKYIKKRKEEKSYIVLYSCTLTRLCI